MKSMQKTGLVFFRDWLPIRKSFVSTNSSSTVPPLDRNGGIYDEEYEKVHVLNEFKLFRTHEIST